MRVIACALALVGCYLIATPIRADQLKMECRDVDDEYQFLFDTISGSLSVTSDPKEKLGGVAGKWNLILAQGGHAVFYYIADDTVAYQVAGRVRILSLNFEKPNMLNYAMGGEMGEPIVSYKADCRRLN